MNTCRTCQQWRPIKTIPNAGECGAPELRYGYTTSIEEVPMNGALIENDEGWGMWTRPNFGCVLHVPAMEDMQP